MVEQTNKSSVYGEQPVSLNVNWMVHDVSKEVVELQ
jgi:hypothetical protein